MNLITTTDTQAAYKDSEFVVNATPTNYDEEKGYFDTSSVENVIETVLDFNPK